MGVYKSGSQDVAILTPTLRKTSLKAVKLDAMRLQVDNWNSAIITLWAPDAELYRLILAMGFGAPIRAPFRRVGGVVKHLL